MTEAEQAAMYEAGVKEYMEAIKFDKMDWSSRHADAVEDYMKLGVSRSDERSKAHKERGLTLLRGVDDRDYFANWPAPEVTIQGYAAWDAAWSMSLYERMAKAKRLATQRPLIHNGRKMKR